MPLRAGPGHQGIVVLVELQADTGIRIDRMGLALPKAALSSVEAVSGGVSPEIRHKGRIVKLFLVQAGERRLGLVVDIGGEQGVTHQRQRPVLPGIQRGHVTDGEGSVQGRFARIDRDGIEDAIRVVPAGITDGGGVDIAEEEDHKTGVLLRVVPGPVDIEISLRVGLQVHIAQAQTGRVADVQHGPHPGRARAHAVPRHIEGDLVVPLVELETRRRRKLPVPLPLAHSILYPVTPGVGLVIHAQHPPAESDPVPFPPFILERHVVLLLQKEIPVDGAVIIVLSRSIEGIPDIVAPGRLQSSQGGKRPLFAQGFRVADVGTAGPGLPVRAIMHRVRSASARGIQKGRFVTLAALDPITSVQAQADIASFLAP